MKKLLLILLLLTVALGGNKGAYETGGMNKGAYQDDPSSECTAPSLTRHATITDTVGNFGRYGHAVSGTIDSTKRIGTWPDSTAMVAYTTKDTIAYRWKSKLAIAGYALRSYGCTDSNTAYDSIAIIGPSVSYSAATDTLNVAMTADVGSTAMADSFTIKTAPLWMDIDRSGATKGRLSGTPDSVKSYTVSVYAWRKNVKADSGNFALTIVSGLRLDSISPAIGKAGTTISVYGRNFGAAQGSSTLAFGDSTPTPSSWSNTRIQFPCPNFTDTGTFDFIVSDGTVADTISEGFFYDYYSMILSGITPATGNTNTSLHLKLWSSNSGIHSPPLCSLFNGSYRLPFTVDSSTVDTAYLSINVANAGTYSVLCINGYGYRDTLVNAFTATIPCPMPTLTRAATRIDTVGKTIVFDHTNSGADSIVAITTLPVGLSITKTGANMGRISGTLTTRFTKAGINLRAYGCNADSVVNVWDTLSVVQFPLITSIKHPMGRIGYVDTTLGSGFGDGGRAELFGTVSTPVTISSQTDSTIIWGVPTKPRGTFYWIFHNPDSLADTAFFRVLVPGKGSTNP